MESGPRDRTGHAQVGMGLPEANANTWVTSAGTVVCGKLGTRLETAPRVSLDQDLNQAPHDSDWLCDDLEARWGRDCRLPPDM